MLNQLTNLFNSGAIRRNAISKKDPCAEDSNCLAGLSHLARELLTGNDSQHWWQEALACISRQHHAWAVAIFGKKNLQQPIISISPLNYQWKSIDDESAGDFKCDKQIWKRSLRLNDEYLLHVENNKKFFQAELDFVELVGNILRLRLQYSNVVGPDEKKHDDDHSTRAALKYDYPEIIGESRSLIKILQVIDKVAGTDISILIQGESGTGKELIAKAIHRYSPRTSFPYISENCAAIPETLLESELFGYIKGSFTGAFQNKKGLFEIADQGTLFMDEVGDMSLAMQKKLLRVLQDGEIRPIGGKATKKVDVRIIAATNKNLQKAIQNGYFREDLYYRLNVVNIFLPPLRERGSDVLSLFRYFVEKNAKAMGIKPPAIDNQVADKLLHYSWPGNIREMENEVKRILALLEDETVTMAQLSPAIVK